tara:strand:+ start:39956 stop:40306 length:351 start_codon:yes stop_codon:yes gene_type:complete
LFYLASEIRTENVDQQPVQIKPAESILSLCLSKELINNAKIAILGHCFFEVNKRTTASSDNGNVLLNTLSKRQNTENQAGRGTQVTLNQRKVRLAPHFFAISTVFTGNLTLCDVNT